MRELVGKLLEKNIMHRPYIDDVVRACLSPWGEKLSEPDQKDLQLYSTAKHELRMRDPRKPGKTYQLLVKQLLKNIMQAPKKSDLYFMETIGLEEEVKGWHRNRLKKYRQGSVKSTVAHIFHHVPSPARHSDDSPVRKSVENANKTGSPEHKSASKFRHRVLLLKQEEEARPSESALVSSTRSAYPPNRPR